MIANMIHCCASNVINNYDIDELTFYLYCVILGLGLWGLVL